VTDETLPDLRPCPFCGDSNASLKNNNEDVVVICETCLAEGPLATIGCRDEVSDLDLDTEAIALWNRRALFVVSSP